MLKSSKYPEFFSIFMVWFKRKQLENEIYISLSHENTKDSSRKDKFLCKFQVTSKLENKIPFLSNLTTNIHI